MPVIKTARLVSLIVILSFFIPSIPSAPVSGGTVWRTATADLHNGTYANATLSPAGIRLPANVTYLNNWTRVDPWPAGRTSANMVYDTKDGVIILFGGVSKTGTPAYNDTWIYNLSTNAWTEKHPLNAPPPGSGIGSAMAYDSANDVVVLFGEDVYTAATWIYNLSANNWTNMYPWPTPRGRDWHSLAYDSANGVVVLFGGNIGGEVNDTWTYNVSNNAWTEMKPANAPPTCGGYAMDYDSVNGVTVLFGGNEYAYVARNDTWTYNFTANNWTKKSNVTAPPHREHASMVYDLAIGKSVLFGGTHFNGTDYVAYNDTWTYNAAADSWSKLTLAGEVPSVRYMHSMAYDMARKEFVIFGGADALALEDETFTLNLTTNNWTRKTTAPTARTNCGMVYAPNDGVVVLFGGIYYTNLNDTWTYDIAAGRWMNRRPSKSPYAEFQGPLAYDTSCGVAVWYTSSPYVTTWLYNVSANTWTDKHPNPQPPGARSGYVLAYDEDNRLTVLQGGGGGNWFNDTWVYWAGNNTWLEKKPATSPTNRSGGSMVYDSGNKVMVLFGGSNSTDFLNDTWTYNVSNNSWVEMKPPISPETRSGAHMVYDEAIGETFLFGGWVQGGATVQNDSWTYNVSTNRWTQLHPVANTNGRGSAGIACDGQNGTIVLFGGWDGCPIADYTTAFDLRRYTSPGNYTSAPTDAGGPAYFGNISWNATVASNTSIRFQLRTSNSSAGLNATNFTGPDGTGASFYNQSGQAINSTHNGSRWMQYRAFLETSDPGYTPILKDVTVRYNRIHTFKLTSPSGGETWNGTVNISWNASDPDGDKLFIDIHLLNGSNDSVMAAGIRATNSSWPWDTSLTPNGTYRIKIFARDDNQTIPLAIDITSPDFSIFHPHINEAPEVTLLSPADYAVVNTSTVNLSWNGTDPEGDPLVYYVYFLNASFDAGDMPPVEVQTCNTFYEKSGLENGTYYWTVGAIDGKIGGAIPEIRRFTAAIPRPNAPPAVGLLHPVNYAIVRSSTVELSWNGTDADQDDLSFRIYLSDVSFDAGNLPPEQARTSETFYEKSGLENGTYYWTVVAFDGKDNGTIPNIWLFSVVLPGPNHPPAISPAYPPDNATMNRSSVELSWNASDGDNDNLTFLLACSDGPFGSGTPSSVSTDQTSFILSNLTDGTTYYWMVTASDGRDNASSRVWRFTVGLPAVNRQPLITSSPGLNATANVTYFYNITASDSDGDQLTFELVSFPTGMELNRSTGKAQWRPGQKGNYTVVVRASDGKGGSDEQSFNLTVDEALIPIIKPRSSISSLSNGSKVSNKLTLQGSVTAGSHTVTLVQVSVDNGSWTDAFGTTSWSYELDTTGLKNGPHTIKVRAFDGTSYSDDASVLFDVDNPTAAPAAAGFPWWILGVVVVLAAVGGATVVLMRRKKAADVAGEPTGATPEKEEPEKKIGPDKEIKRKEPSKHAGVEKGGVVPKKEKAPVVEKKPAVAEAKVPVVAATVAPVPGAIAVPASVPFATKLAPEGFAVEDIFLMYIDGRLILHTTRRIKADMDADIMASMLTAVQAFIKESVGMDTGTELGAMEYGNNKILLQKGKYVVLASVIEGAEPAEFRDEMRHTVSNIESEFGPALASWDGMATRLAGAKRFLGQLGAYKAAEAAVTEKAKTDISLKGELEFYQGFVRLKVAVKNGMDTFINDASFRLVYKDAVLRLDHIEPSYPQKGDEVILGNIEPREKKTIAFYLDPQICTESFLEGILSYKDMRGNLEMLKLPRKLASVVCPIMYSDENINTAMLKRMAAEELDKKDTKVFAVPPALAPETAFDLAEAAVQHHDVRLVREFTEKDPFVGEAWYFGKAKGRDDRIVIRARVLADKNVLEFFVASSSTLMLTGMLAELKADLNKELAAQRGAPEMRQVTAPQEVDAVAMVRTLLDKAAELEQAAGETEVKG